MTRRFLPLALVLLTATLASAQPKKSGALPPDKALATMQPGDGFQVEPFAAEPMLFNPTSIDVDHKGRVWVAEAVNYRRKAFGRPIIRKEGDRIVVLVDTNNDGKADESKVFYQGEDLYGPLSVCVIPQASRASDGTGSALRVLVAQSPDILEFWDRDGDLKADGPPKKFLSGFGGFDHDHGVHGLNVGPDGKLYFTVGDSGVTGLQSSDGKGKKWVSNTTDVQKGTVWRCDLDGKNLELIAHNFRNNYECCVDSFGEIWLSDNDDDGNFQTRICFVMPGGNYGYGPRGTGQTHWHEEQPGIVHKVLRTGFGSPTGITFYEGSLFPKKYAGALLHCDAGPREVRAFHRKAVGAGYQLDKEVILTSTDTWFRPSDVCVAPDGSIFVADWYDKGVGGHNMEDPQDGRIYRLTPKGHKGYTVPEVKLDTKEGILAALGSPCLATQAMAKTHLRPLPAKAAFGTLIEGVKTESRTLQARCHWQICYLAIATGEETWPDAEGKGAYDKFFASKGQDADFLALFFRAAFDTKGRDPGRILQMSEKHLTELTRLPILTYDLPHVRETLLGLRGAPAERMKPLFYALAKKYDGSDHFYRAALNIACGTDPARRDAILADFDKHFPEWNDKVADLVWELRPKSVLPRLGKLLADPKLTAAQKARIVDIIASNDDLAAGQTMLDVLKSDAAPEMKARAIESLKLFLPTKWAGLRTGKELGAAIDALLADEKTAVTGLQLIAAAGATDRVDAVVKLATGGNREAIRTLGRLRTQKSVETLKAIAEEPTFTTKPAAGIEALAALGLLSIGNAKDEIVPKALAVLQAQIARKDYPPMQAAAIEALTSSRPGSLWLLDAHKKGELPKELAVAAGRLLRNSPFQDVNAQAQLAFPAPGKLNPKNLPPIGELAKRTGDATRGKQVWAASFAGAAQCSKCHMVRGVGGQVGPDLSMIGKKGGREALLESILNPSKAIADQYLQHSVTTTAEVTITGLLVNDTPASLTIRDANGKDTTIGKKDVIGEVRKLKISIMPEDIVAGLTEDEMIDMVAYLETLKVAAFTPDSFRVVGPFKAATMDAALDTKFGPEKGAFDPSAKFGNLAWKSIRPDGKGYFDLAALHGTAANNSASYMYTEVDSPVEQDAEVLLGTDDGVNMWVNGEMRLTERVTRAAAPEQSRTAVKLKKGKNTILLKVANGNIPHGFYFSLTSPEEVKPVVAK